LLNNLLGRFGIRMDKSISDILSLDTFNKLSAMKKVRSYKYLSDDKVMLSYVDKFDANVISSHNMDIVKLSSKYKDAESSHMDNTSVVISAAITAYARIHISKIKLDILNKAGNIYYSDTDSIVTDVELYADMVDVKSLGKLKLEHEIKKGIFISGKTYCFITTQGKYINKAKGVKSSSLEYEDYVSLINNTNVKTASKISNKVDWTEAHVLITNNTITLNADSYKKRVKIYDSKNVWCNTKPILINKASKDIIIPSKKKVFNTNKKY